MINDSIPVMPADFCELKIKCSCGRGKANLIIQCWMVSPSFCQVIGGKGLQSSMVGITTFENGKLYQPGIAQHDENQNPVASCS